MPTLKLITGQRHSRRRLSALVAEYAKILGLTVYTLDTAPTLPPAKIEIWSLNACPECGLVGGCEHTFKDELPYDRE